MSAKDDLLVSIGQSLSRAKAAHLAIVGLSRGNDSPRAGAMLRGDAAQARAAIEEIEKLKRALAKAKNDEGAQVFADLSAAAARRAEAFLAQALRAGERAASVVEWRRVDDGRKKSKKKGSFGLWAWAKSPRKAP